MVQTRRLWQDLDETPVISKSRKRFSWKRDQEALYGPLSEKEEPFVYDDEDSEEEEDGGGGI